MLKAILIDNLFLYLFRTNNQTFRYIIVNFNYFFLKRNIGNVIETWMNIHVKCQQNILDSYFKYLKKDAKKINSYRKS